MKTKIKLLLVMLMVVITNEYTSAVEHKIKSDAEIKRICIEKPALCYWGSKIDPIERLNHPDLYNNPNNYNKAIDEYFSSKQDAELLCKDSPDTCKGVNKYLKEYESKHPTKGEVINTLSYVPLDNGFMKVLVPFGYRVNHMNPEGEILLSAEWLIPENTVVNTITMPEIIMDTITSDPLSDNLMRAVLVHFYYCLVKRRSWQDTHDIFHEIMIQSGVDEVTATVLYYSAYRFSLRWGCSMGTTCHSYYDGYVYIPEFNVKEFIRVKYLIENKEILAEDIPHLVRMIDDQYWNYTVGY